MCTVCKIYYHEVCSAVWCVQLLGLVLLAIATILCSLLFSVSGQRLCACGGGDANLLGADEDHHGCRWRPDVRWSSAGRLHEAGGPAGPVEEGGEGHTRTADLSLP